MATDNQKTAGVYYEGISSMHDFAFEPQVMMKMYQRYGKGNTMTDTFRKMGLDFTFAGNTLTAQEKGRITRTITTNGASTGGATAGSAVTIVLSADDIDSDGNCYPRVGFSVLYQHTNNKVYELRIESKTATSSSSSGSAYDTYALVLKPLDGSLAVGVGGIADGTVLSIGASSFATGVGQPESTTNGLFERTFKSRIIKESLGMDGTELARARWEEKMVNGQKKYWSEAYAETEYLMDLQNDLAIFIGNENTNSLTQTGQDGKARAIKSAKGLWNWMDELAGKLNYGTSTFDIFEFNKIAPYLRSQNVVTDVVGLFVGPGLMTKIEDAGYDFLKDYSSSEMKRVIGTAYKGREDWALGGNFKVITKDGITYVITVLDTFGNPTLLGNPTYDFNNSGFAVPLGATIKDGKDPNVKYDTMGCGYMSHNGTDRKRVISTQNGMTGLSGNLAITQYDNVNLYMLSEIMPFAMEVNKWVQILPYA